MFPTGVVNEFGQHAQRLRQRARARREAVQMRSVVHDADHDAADADDELGRRLPVDKFSGDTNLRTLRALLKMCDERGFERCAPHAFFLARRVSHALRTRALLSSVFAGQHISSSSIPLSKEPRRACSTKASGVPASPP